jgi:hypothetical protein
MAVAVWRCCAGATQRLAVDRDRPPPLSLLRFKAVVVMAVADTQPGADRGGQGLGVKPAERAADGGLGRDHEATSERIAAGAERGPNRLGRVGGPLGDGDRRPGTRQHRGRRQGQDGDQRVAAPRARPWVGMAAR